MANSMHIVRLPQIATALVLAAGLVLPRASVAAPIVSAAPRVVTNTTSGQNQNPSITSSGKLIVFTANVDHSSGAVLDPQTGTFDFDRSGNDFTPVGATDPNPMCINCDAQNSLVGNLFLWRLKKSGASKPANSFEQITFSTTGGLTANQLADIAQNGSLIAWDSDRDHAAANCKKIDGTPCDNSDGNREIFTYTVKTGQITQITDTSASADTANRSANVSDNGRYIVWDSTRNYAGILGCTLGDGVTACDNADGNSEIMRLDLKEKKLIQVTSTTGGLANSNLRARLSADGGFVAWQSTRDFASVAGCVQLDGTTTCDNADANGEIMLFDVKKNVLRQVTTTTNTFPCTGTTPNERVEISSRGKYLSFQSKCEAQLNPSPACGACNGNDEGFLADIKKKKITQLTISKAGFNRVPRVSGSGAYIVFQSDREYMNLGTNLKKTLFILKRSSGKTPAGQSSPMTVINDVDLVGVTQNPKTKLVNVDILNGFNTTVEQFGISSNGKYVTFDNQSGVRNQEIWFVDRTK